MQSIPDLELDSIRFRNPELSRDNIEYALIKIVNRIGTFITYILIEAMSPTGKITNSNMRTKAGLDFINNAISLPDLFGTFLNILPKEYTKDIAKGIELKEASYNKLSNSLAKIYPEVHKVIEGEYLSHFEAFYLDKDRYPNNCGHDWKEKSLYKLGKYYECTKCGRYESSVPQTDD